MRKTTLPVLLLTLVSACAGPRYARWDGRRGYNGSGDYGYDLNASRAEARNYRARAQSHYPVPGTPDDPWGPYIQQAAGRFAIPARWIREVMHQESGGRLENSSGGLTTSPVGAMGLMQVMPATYDTLRRHYGLGDDPYEPHDNIMAGAAYIREMYDRFGSPGFLAAYNAGPDRLDAYLAGSTELPDETRNYVARIAPRLGTEVAASGPLAVYAAGGSPARATDDGAYAGGGYAVAANDPSDAAYAGGGMSGVNYYSADRDAVAAAAPAAAPAPVTASAQPAPVAMAAYAPPSSPAPRAYAQQPYAQQPYAQQPYAQQSAYPSPSYQTAAYQRSAELPPPVPFTPSFMANPPASNPAANPPSRPHLFARAEAAEPMPRVNPASALVPLAAPGSASGGWGIQVGAFPDPAQSRMAAQTARATMAGPLAGTHPILQAVDHNGATFYRARLVGLSPQMAAAACEGLSRHGMACFTVPPGS